MKTKGFGLTVSLLLLLALVAACAPTAPSTPTAVATPTLAPIPTKAPAVAPAPAAAPSPTPAAAAAVPGEKPVYGGRLMIAENMDIRSADPHEKTSGVQDTPILDNVYSPLVRMDGKTGALVPVLALRWEATEGGKVYTFFLRRNAKYHNGQPVTAEDVAYTINRWITMPGKVTGPRVAAVRAMADKAEAVDESTVRVTLKAPAVAFMSAMANPFAVIGPPKAILQDIDKTGRRFTDADWIGSGPFKLKRQVWDLVTELDKNPNYFVEGQPYLDGITRIIIVDQSTHLAAFRTKRIHLTSLAMVPSITEVRDVKAALGERIGVGEEAPPIVYYVGFNTAIPPWNDVRLRKAVHLALDRQEMVNVLLGGAGVLTTPYFHGWENIYKYEDYLKMPGFRQPKDADIAEAKRLVQEAVGGKVTDNILCRTLLTYCDLAQAVSSQLKPIGITLNVESVEPRAGNVRLTQKDYHVCSQRLAVAFDDPDAYSTGLYLKDATSNYWNWSNDRLEALYVLQKGELDPAKRGALHRQIIDILLQEQPLTWTVTEKQFLLWWAEVKGVAMAKQAHPDRSLGHVWLAR